MFFCLLAGLSVATDLSAPEHFWAAPHLRGDVGDDSVVRCESRATLVPGIEVFFAAGSKKCEKFVENILPNLTSEKNCACHPISPYISFLSNYLR